MCLGTFSIPKSVSFKGDSRLFLFLLVVLPYTLCRGFPSLYVGHATTFNLAALTRELDCTCLGRLVEQGPFVDILSRLGAFAMLSYHWFPVSGHFNVVWLPIGFSHKDMYIGVSFQILMIIWISYTYASLEVRDKLLLLDVPCPPHSRPSSRLLSSGLLHESFIPL